MEKQKTGVCPVCGSEDISYESMELGIMGDSIYYPATCNHCHAKFKEHYTLEFAGQEVE